MQVQDIGASVGASEYAFDEYASWATPINHRAPSFNVAARSNLAWTPASQGYPPLGDDSNTSEQEIYGLGNPSQTSPANQYVRIQDWPSTNQGNSLSSPSTETLPGLTNSFRTVSDVSDTEITESGRFTMEFAQIAEMEKQASFSGFSAAETAANMPCTQNNVIEAPEGLGLGFDFDAFPDSASFQQYPEPLDSLAANSLSDGLFEAGSGMLTQFPTENYHQCNDPLDSRGSLDGMSSYTTHM